MIAIIEDLIRAAGRGVAGGLQITYGGKPIDLTPPWPRRSMAELVREKTGVDFLAISDDAGAHRQARALGVEIPETSGWGRALEAVFAHRVEDTLIPPLHVTEFPREISPLAKGHRSDPRLTERFETYVNGWEVANAFSEINDPQDQRARFEAQMP